MRRFRNSDYTKKKDREFTDSEEDDAAQSYLVLESALSRGFLLETQKVKASMLVVKAR